MRNVIWLVLLFTVAVVAALTLGDNAGLASFYWDTWRLDLSINLFLLLAIGAGFAVVTAVHAVNALIGLPEQAREWRLLRLERAAHAALREAQAEYFAARYGRAHIAAQRASAIWRDVPALAADAQFDMLAQLLAAASQHRLQDRKARDAALANALKPALKAGRKLAGSAADDGARLLAAEWALDDRDGPRASALLADLPPGVARRTQALRLRLQAARQARLPLDALHTARLLANHQAFSRTAALGLLRSLAIEALDAPHDADQLRRTWQQFDGADQRDPFVAARAARRAASLGAPEDGRAWLRPLWDRLDGMGADGRAELALALVDAVAGLSADWLPRIEAAQRAYSTEPAVQAAVGAVLVERQLWGKAQRPLELAAQDTDLPARARRQAWRGLARLAQAQGDAGRANDCYRSAAGVE